MIEGEKKRTAGDGFLRQILIMSDQKNDQHHFFYLFKKKKFLMQISALDFLLKLRDSH